MDCAVMEYTRAKPWPFFMYKSLIAVNCSYAGVGGGGIQMEKQAMSSVISSLAFYMLLNIQFESSM